MSIISPAVHGYAVVWPPPPDLTVSQWADEFRRLSAEASSEPGRWNTDRAPYQRGILDALNDPDIHTVVVMSSAQIGKTELLLNVIGYYIHQDPSPILCLQPTLDMAETFSKDRLAPMVRDTPAISDKIAPNRARDSGNTLLHKKFPGGHITMAGANSPASLASRPIRIVLCDEIDRYPISAASEGDPVNLARKRTNTFWNRKVILTSTPTIKGISRIEDAYMKSDQRKYHVQCPECEDYFVIRWELIEFDRTDIKSAKLTCECCGSLIEEKHKMQMLRNGQWIAESESNGVAGFHLSEFYSPWRHWWEIAEDFLKSKDSTEQLKVWVNTSLGETWEEQGDSIDDLSLISRLEEYPDNLPVKVRTAGVDVQKDRLEISIFDWGDGEECWAYDHVILVGDTAQPDVWDQLHEELTINYVDFAAIDSGYNTSMVYAFCEGKRWCVPIKGVTGINRPIIEDQKKRAQRLRNRRKKGAYVEPIGVDQGKALVYSRLKANQPGPGYIHFPQSPSFDDEYFAQLAAEKLVTKMSRGRAHQEWIQTRPRNEALDCMVYGLAAMRLLDTNIESMEVKKKPEEKAKRSGSINLANWKRKQ